MYRGDFEHAYEVFNSTPLERNPTLWVSQMATVLFRLGRTDEAWQLIDKFLKENPKDEGGLVHSVRAMMLAKTGARAAALADITTAIQLGKGYGHFHHTAYNIASAYALLGDRAQAVRWLQSAADDGFPCYPLFASDKFLDSLRTDQAFTTMMATLKADWSARVRDF